MQSNSRSISNTSWKSRRTRC